MRRRKKSTVKKVAASYVRHKATQATGIPFTRASRYRAAAKLLGIR
jgi:hypothetical protein